MLFDLRGRGRRRTVQVIYLSLAMLMGGGLVLFGIGGGTNGGLFDAIGGSGGSSTSTDKVFQKRLAAYERQLKVNPQDAAALIGMTKLRFGNASTGENFNQTQGAYTAKGLAELRQASAAWQRYLATNPAKPDAEHRQPHGPGLRARRPQAVRQGRDRRWRPSSTAARRPRTSTPSSRSWPPAPSRTARATLAEAEGPRAHARRTSASSSSRQIDLQKSQLTVQQPAQPQSG